MQAGSKPAVDKHTLPSDAMEQGLASVSHTAGMPVSKATPGTAGIPPARGEAGRMPQVFKGIRYGLLRDESWRWDYDEPRRGAL